MDAHDYICDSKSVRLYEWHEIDMGDSLANVLLVRRDYFGENFLLNNGDYQGRDDKGFYGPLEYIYMHLEEVGENYTQDNFFRLQMLYMLLWSAIDKYLSLCYEGWNQRKTVNEWAEWGEF